MMITINMEVSLAAQLTRISYLIRKQGHDKSVYNSSISIDLKKKYKYTTNNNLTLQYPRIYTLCYGFIYSNTLYYPNCNKFNTA